MASFAQKHTLRHNGRLYAADGQQSTFCASLPVAEPIRKATLENQVLNALLAFSRKGICYGNRNAAKIEDQEVSLPRLAKEAGKGSFDAIARLELLEAETLLRHISDQSYGDEPLHSEAKGAYYRTVVRATVKRLIREDPRRQDGPLLKCLALGEIERGRITDDQKCAAVEILAISGEAGFIAQIARSNGEAGQRAKELTHLATELQLSRSQY